MPTELNLTNTPGAFTKNLMECWKIYKTFAAEIIDKNKVVQKDDPFIGITEHDLSATEKVVVLVNYSSTDRAVALTFKDSWKVGKTLYGNLPTNSSVKLNANDACVLQLMK